MEVGHSIEVCHKPGHELAYSLAETSLYLKKKMQPGKHCWSKIGRHPLSQTVFLHHICKVKPIESVKCLLATSQRFMATMGKLS